MRIISGKYKSRHFSVPPTFKARPTTDFAKENIFNILLNYIEFEGLTALDLFSGTGSISVELLSRGCKQVTSIELNSKHFAFQKKVQSELKPQGWTLLNGDVFRYLEKCTQKFDIIFADPPYDLKELETIPDIILNDKELLNPEGLFILEHGRNNDFSGNKYFLRHKTYGSVNFTIFGNPDIYE